MTTFTAPGPVATVTGNRPHTRGDEFDAPIMLLDDAGTVDLFFWGAGPQESEPGVRPAATHSDESIWLDFFPTVPGTLTLTTPSPMTVDMGSSDAVENFAVQVTGDSSTGGGVATILGSNSPIRIRVRPRHTGDMVEKVVLTWAYEELIPPVIVSVLSDLPQAPGTFRITVTNGDPGATITIDDEFGDGPLDFDLDDDGSLISMAWAVLDPQDAGSYDLTVSHPGRDDVTVSFVIVNDALTDPIGQDADASPVYIDPIGGVQKWVLQDPAPSGVQYVFEINPDSATSPHGENTFTDDVTVAPDGQNLTWEGARRAVSWSFKGTLLTQTQFEGLQHFAGLNRRVYLIDNRNRAWVVVIDSFDPEFKQTQDYPWFHTYVVNATIFAGPIEAP